MAVKFKDYYEVLGVKRDANDEQIRQAYAEIDQVLTPRQRAQFRVFEEMMERQKLDMLARAQLARPPVR